MLKSSKFVVKQLYWKVIPFDSVLDFYTGNKKGFFVEKFPGFPGLVVGALFSSFQLGTLLNNETTSNEENLTNIKI